MSHSKYTKRGYSLYIEKWNPSAKKYINTCAICGHKGYSPVIEDANFCNNLEKTVIYRELTKTLCRIELDETGKVHLFHFSVEIRKIRGILKRV